MSYDVPPPDDDAPPDNLFVRAIKREECYPWILQKHYARRMPGPIMFAFGLYGKGKKLIGIVTYGRSGNMSNNTIAGFPAMELSRLCIEDGSPKNSASILVGRSLQMLPMPCCIVSYADPDQSHVGYVYQATNWIYTGLGCNDTEFVLDGQKIHRKSAYDRHGTGSIDTLGKLGYGMVRKQGKHRYLFFVGTKKQKKEMLSSLKWPILPYPKGQSMKYDAGKTIETQGLLL